MAVIFFHAGYTYLPGGFLGVDVFFVISGYLITSIILGEKDAGSFTFRRFYARRIRRILPLMIFVVLCTIPVSFLLLLPGDLEVFSATLIGALTFSVNLMAANNVGYFEPNAKLQPLLHLWSLAVEEQFYLFYPVLLTLIGPFGRRSKGVVLIALSGTGIWLADMYSVRAPDAAFYLLPTRGWTILIGAAAALLPSRGRLSINHELPSGIGLLMILSSFVVFSPASSIPGVSLLWPTLGAFLVVVFTTQGTLVYQILTNRPVRWIGMISYGAYLWHNPIFSLVKYQTPFLTPWTKAGLVVLTLGLATLSYHLIENPFRSSARVSGRRVFILLTAGTVLIGAAGLVGFLSKGLPQRFDAHARQILDQAENRNPRRAECTANGLHRVIPGQGCVLGNPVHVSWALLGDSHADALSIPLAQELDARGLGMIELTHAGCPPGRGLRRAGTLDTYCADFMETALNYLIENPKINSIIVHARFTLYLEGDRFDNGDGGREQGGFVGFEAIGIDSGAARNSGRKAAVAGAYQEMIRALLAAGKRVILITSVPEAGWDVPRKMLQIYLETGQATDLTTSLNAFTNRNATTLAAFAALSGSENLTIIGPEELFCTTPELGGRCILSSSGLPLYADTDHLTNSGAALLVNRIADELY